MQIEKDRSPGIVDWVAHRVGLRTPRKQSTKRAEAVEKVPVHPMITRSSPRKRRRSRSKSIDSQLAERPRGARQPPPTDASQKKMAASENNQVAPVQELVQRAAAEFTKNLQAPEDQRQYDESKKDLLEEEKTDAWDAKAKATASEAERNAAWIVWKIREHERENLFGNKASEAIPGPETLDMGGQFLTNKERIENQSRLFKIARRMPKGAHLHLHFNAEISPRTILEKARNMNNMFIRSTQPLLSKQDLTGTEMVFSVMPIDTVTANIFTKTYNPDFKTPGSNPWMKWSTFREKFEQKFRFNAEGWIVDKMILSEEEVYSANQTTNGIWARFNQATRCFKGLLNYEDIFRWYIGAAVDNMIEDGVMYAELRPMLMDKSIPSTDGDREIFHEAQMNIIIEEISKKKQELESGNKLHKFPFGIKIIYCAPRSIPKTWMQRELQDCIKLKLEFPDLICGFDLVGAEDRPNSIGFYRDELLAFVETCKTLNIDIPFMFHAGETLLDTGGSRNPSNSNLYDAVLLNAKRIGHGFSLVKHPQLVKKFKERPICIELCPTSNELLHLCRNIKEHPYPQILALGIPCTVNSDNPSLFSNSVSHEFYQVMVGSTTMSVHGWRQLAEWSLEFSCLSDSEKKEGLEIFRREWEEFCMWIVEEYGAYAEGLDIQQVG